MTFFDEIIKLENRDLAADLNAVTPSQVDRVLGQEYLSADDYLALLSPAAADSLERMAALAHRLTIQHFGRTIALYTPLYLANYCENLCLYCGFNASNSIPRRQLTLPEVEAEARAIAQTGLEHILILTGESRKYSSVSYIKDCVSILKKYFSSISIEIYPLSTQEYSQLVQAGVDGLTIYQEVYDRQVYSQLHPAGPKRDYRFRLETPERAGLAGMRTLNVGALLGLADWRREVLLAGLHAAYLQKFFPDAEIGMSFPRMRPEFGGYEPEHPVSDRQLVQSILALRLFLPRVGIAMSTRESASLRDNLIKLGVTKMSAGSSTVIGGHTDSVDGTGQFEISDKRSVAEMRQAIFALGYKPILKDWHSLDYKGRDNGAKTLVS